MSESNLTNTLILQQSAQIEKLSSRIDGLVLNEKIRKRETEKLEPTKKSRKQIDPLEEGYHTLLYVYQYDNQPAFFGPEKKILTGKDIKVIQILRTLKEEKDRLLFALALEDLLLTTGSRNSDKHNQAVYIEFMGCEFDRSKHGQWIYTSVTKKFNRYRTDNITWIGVIPTETTEWCRIKKIQ